MQRAHLQSLMAWLLFWEWMHGISQTTSVRNSLPILYQRKMLPNIVAKLEHQNKMHLHQGLGLEKALPKAVHVREASGLIKNFNMFTFKWHNLTHYPSIIHRFATLNLLGTHMVRLMKYSFNLSFRERQNISESSAYIDEQTRVRSSTWRRLLERILRMLLRR